MNQTPKRDVYFVTFGGPTPNFHRRVATICHQAFHFDDIFTQIRGYTDVDLRADAPFWEKHGNFIESNRRGYGYWIWKPHLIQKTLNEMELNDVLVYADAGCNLNASSTAIERMYEYIKMVDSSFFGLLSFQMEHLPEYKYTKRQTFDAVSDNNTHQNTGQCMATAMVIRKNAHTVNLVNEWVYYSQIYDLINDKTGVEYTGFIDHRHDQSIYSILVKKYGSIKIPDETFFAPDWTTRGINYPIWAVRDKRG
jgi:hypothetical protein